MLNAKEIIAAAVKALDEKKGKDLKVLFTADQTTLADYFIICTGTSNTQVRALAEAVEEALSKAGEEPHHIEGHRGGAVDAAGLLRGGHSRVHRGGAGVLRPGAAVVGRQAGGRVPVPDGGRRVRRKGVS